MGARALRTAAVAAVLVLGGCAASAQQAPAGPDGVRRVEVAFAGGAVVGGPAVSAVPLGSTVEVVVTSDVADEVHVHGYDRSAYVTAGASAAVRFVADVPGAFEVELEERAVPLARLQVS